MECDVDSAHIEKDVFCGELKGNTIDTLTAMLTEIFLPLLKVWLDCADSSGVFALLGNFMVIRLSFGNLKKSKERE